MTVFRRLAGLALGLLAAPSPATAATAQVPDLQALLRAPVLPLSGAAVPEGSLQERFQRLSGEIAAVCRKSSVDESMGNRELALACLWPRVAAELDETTSALSKTSPDPRRLFLTLAARLHPADFFTPAVLREGAVGFDALFARYLMAHRMVRDVWPAVEDVLRARRLLHEPEDRLVEPWLTTATPWSFALGALRRYSCNGPEIECAAKKAFGEVVVKAVALIEEDEALASVTRLSPADFALAGPSSAAQDPREADLLMHDLLRGLFEGASGNYVFFARDSGDPAGLARQIRVYLDAREGDSARPLAAVVAPSGDFCADFARLGAPVARGIGCAGTGEEARVRVAGALQARGDLYRFGFAQLRATLAMVARANVGLSSARISARQRERAMRDALEALGAIRRIRFPGTKTMTADEARRAARPLVIYLYDMIDGTEER